MCCFLQKKKKFLGFANIFLNFLQLGDFCWELSIEEVFYLIISASPVDDEATIPTGGVPTPTPPYVSPSARHTCRHLPYSRRPPRVQNFREKFNISNSTTPSF